MSEAAEPRLAAQQMDPQTWFEVKAQMHGDKRVSVWKRYLGWMLDRRPVALDHDGQPRAVPAEQLENETFSTGGGMGILADSPPEVSAWAPVRSHLASSALSGQGVEYQRR